MNPQEQKLRSLLKKTMPKDALDHLITDFRNETIKESMAALHHHEDEYLDEDMVFTHSSKTFTNLLNTIKKTHFNGPLATGLFAKAAYVIGQHEPLHENEENEKNEPHIDLSFLRPKTDTTRIQKAQEQLLERYRDMLDHSEPQHQRKHKKITADTLLSFIQKTREQSLTNDQRAEHIGIIKTHLINLGYTTEDIEKRIQNPLMNRAYKHSTQHQS